MVGERSRRRSAAGEMRLSMGRAMPFLGVDVPARRSPRTSRPGAARSAACRSRRSKLALATIVSPPIISRSKRGLQRLVAEAELHQRRLEQHAPAVRAAEADRPRPRRGRRPPGGAGCRSRTGASSRSASRSGVGWSACQASATDGSSGTRASVSSTVTVSALLPRVDAELDRPAVVRAGGGSQAPMPVCRALASGTGGEQPISRGEGATHRMGAAGVMPPPPARGRGRDAATCRRRPAWAVCGRRLRRLAPRLRAARLIAHGDEQRGDVLAVLPRLGECRAGAVRLNAVGRQIDADRVGVGVGALDAALRARFGDLDVLDDAASRVVEPAQERSCAEQTAKSAVAER